MLIKQSKSLICEQVDLKKKDNDKSLSSILETELLKGAMLKFNAS